MIQLTNYSPFRIHCLNKKPIISMRLLRSPAQCGDLICNLAVPIVWVSLSNLFTLSSLLLQAAAMTASYLPATQYSIALASKAEDPFEAISILHKIPENPSSSPDALRVKEQAGLKYLGRELDVVKAVADAHSNRSLRSFEKVLRDYKDQLEKDPTVCNHLSSRYEALVELNLCGYVEPFSRVEISHIARLINLPVHLVEKRLTLLSIKILMLEILESFNGPTGYLFVPIFENPP